MKFTLRLNEHDEEALRQYMSIHGGFRGKNHAIRQAIRDAIRYHRLMTFLQRKIKRMLVLTQDEIDEMEEITLEV